jgi:hypothetical protein
MVQVEQAEHQQVVEHQAVLVHQVQQEALV